MFRELDRVAPAHTILTTNTSTLLVSDLEDAVTRGDRFAALRLVLDNHATVEDVDRAWMSDRNAPMGPFGMMDLFGLDLMLDTWRRPREDEDRQALASKLSRSSVQPWCGHWGQRA